MKWVIVADEVGVLGWRLAGAQALITDEHTVDERLAEARQGADLVLITADFAKRLPESLLGAALLEERPLIGVIADLRGGGEPPDLEREVKHVLGLAV
jgi:vacuolar-type H+-ATPase subunit F/Vma7